MTNSVIIKSVLICEKYLQVYELSVLLLLAHAKHCVLLSQLLEKNVHIPVEAMHVVRECCHTSFSITHQTKTSSAPSGKRKHVLIENPRQLAAYFASCVTTESDSDTHWVAKNGENSLFKILQRMIPEVRIVSLHAIVYFEENYRLRKDL
jgi:hypothetical protein